MSIPSVQSNDLSPAETISPYPTKPSYDVHEMMAAAGWSVGNVDLTVIAQAPRLGSHIAKMRAFIAEDLRVSQDQVNIKATTTERLGFVGREEGIASHAVALIVTGGATE